MTDDEHTQIIPPERPEGTLWYDDKEWKLKEWKNGEWRTLKFKYEDKKYIDPSVVGWACIILAVLLLLGLGICSGGESSSDGRKEWTVPIKSYPKGARKAYRRMQKQYGTKKGRSVFFALANKKGKGKSQSAKVRSAYRKKKKRKF